jgi:hypothetical protein
MGSVCRARWPSTAKPPRKMTTLAMAKGMAARDGTLAR